LDNETGRPAADMQLADFALGERNGVGAAESHPLQEGRDMPCSWLTTTAAIGEGRSEGGKAVVAISS